MTESELKPCPFCGCENINMHANYNRKIARYFVFARCDRCKSTGRTFVCKCEYEAEDESLWEDNAVYYAECAWNRRTY